MPYSTERLGEVLLHAGLVTDDQILVALKEQAESGDKLGSILVRSGVVSEDEIAEALASQKGLEHVNLASIAIDPAAAGLILPRMARRHQIVPIAVTADTLVLAMADPLDVQAVDETELVTKLTVVPVVAPASQIRMAIEKYVYGADALNELVRTQEVTVSDDAESSDDDSGVAIIRMVNQIIREAALLRASDIHFEPGDNTIRVRYRVDGVLRESTGLPKSSQSELLSRIKIMADLDITERRRPQDGRLAVRVDDKYLDVRVATLPTPKGESITLRLLDSEIAFRPVEELSIPEREQTRLLSMLHKPYGALMVAGPTGSGKSTTLYALLNELNDETREIITVEDPIEYNMDGITQIAVNPRIGLTFASGLRTILRSDPDVVMVGEIRDPETAEVAVRAALTGHLVLSSIHTNDAPSALTRLTDMGIAPYVIASGLLGVMAQRLVRCLCSHCKRPQHLSKEQLILAGFTEVEIDYFTPFEAVGCEHCGNTGYAGRIGVFEVMEFTDKLQSLLLHNAPAESIRQAAIHAGMKTLRRDALDKVVAGVTSLQEIDRVVV